MASLKVLTNNYIRRAGAIMLDVLLRNLALSIELLLLTSLFINEDGFTGCRS